MTPIERVVIEWECARLINLYARLTDAGRYEEVAELFTEDGAFARPAAPDQVVRGRAAILAHYRARPPRFTQHLVGNIVVTAESPTVARADSSLLLFTAAAADPPAGNVRNADSAQLLATFADRLVRRGNDWLFAERFGRLTLTT